MTSSVISDNFETSTGAIPTLGGDSVETRLCRAWVNFNGTGTVAIRASYNVSSITDNGTADYTVNFTTAMSDTNYVMVGSSADNNGGATSTTVWSRSHAVAPTTTAQRIGTTGLNNVTYDTAWVYVTIFR